MEQPKVEDQHEAEPKRPLFRREAAAAAATVLSAMLSRHSGSQSSQNLLWMLTLPSMSVVDMIKRKLLAWIGG